MIDEGFSVLSESCKGNMVVSNHSQENVYLQNSGSFLPNNDIQAILSSSDGGQSSQLCSNSGA